MPEAPQETARRRRNNSPGGGKVSGATVGHRMDIIPGETPAAAWEETSGHKMDSPDQRETLKGTTAHRTDIPGEVPAAAWEETSGHKIGSPDQGETLKRTTARRTDIPGEILAAAWEETSGHKIGSPDQGQILKEMIAHQMDIIGKTLEAPQEITGRGTDSSGRKAILEVMGTTGCRMGHRGGEPTVEGITGRRIDLTVEVPEVLPEIIGDRMGTQKQAAPGE